VTRRVAGHGAEGSAPQPARVGVAAGPGVTVVDTVYEAGTSASRMSVYSDPFCCSLPSLISKVSSE
jgi:hypothetical protein